MDKFMVPRYFLGSLFTNKIYFNPASLIEIILYKSAKKCHRQLCIGVHGHPNGSYVLSWTYLDPKSWFQPRIFDGFYFMQVCKKGPSTALYRGSWTFGRRSGAANTFHGHRITFDSPRSILCDVQVMFSIMYCIHIGEHKSKRSLRSW